MVLCQYTYWDKVVYNGAGTNSERANQSTVIFYNVILNQLNTKTSTVRLSFLPNENYDTGLIDLNKNRNKKSVVKCW